MFVASEELKMQNVDTRHQVKPDALTQDVANQGLTRAGNLTVGLPPQPTAEVTTPETVAEQYLVFTVLENECAIKAEHIQGVERLVEVTPVPNVAHWIRGIMNLRGSIVSVIDLRAFLDREQLPTTPRTRVLSVQYNEMVICFIVDGVSDMIPIPAAAVSHASSGSPGGFSISSRQPSIPSWAVPYAIGSAVVGKRVIVLLDAARLLFSDKIQHYEA